MLVLIINQDKYGFIVRSHMREAKAIQPRGGGLYQSVQYHHSEHSEERMSIEVER